MCRKDIYILCVWSRDDFVQAELIVKCLVSAGDLYSEMRNLTDVEWLFGAVMWKSGAHIVTLYQSGQHCASCVGLFVVQLLNVFVAGSFTISS